MMKFSDTIQKLVDMSLLPIKYLQFLITKLGNSISDFFDSCVTTRRNLEKNITALRQETWHLSSHTQGNTKLTEFVWHLYVDAFFGDRPDIKKKYEKMSKAYNKVVGPAYNLVTNNWYEENFDTQKIAKIIVDILYLKKDELDKIDGGLPVV